MAEPMILRANALTTLDRLKSFLCIPADEEDSERDAALTQLINAASAWLETKLGRKLGRQTYDEPHFGTGTQRLVLNQYPIISIRHIRDNRTGAEIAGYDFVEEGEIGVVYREDGWTYYGHIGGLSYDYVAPRRYLTVNYTAGYVLPKDATVLDAIEATGLEQVCRLSRFRMSPGRLTRTSVRPGRTSSLCIGSGEHGKSV